MSAPPRILISASAIGYYGSRGDEVLTEQSPPGSGFLADLCAEWEAATELAAEAGIHVTTARIGVVLASNGGALAKMLPALRLGLGGWLGSGRQYMSWIAIEDIVGALLHLLSADTVLGPVNLVAPNPVTNAAFAETLGRAFGRRALLPVPASALRVAFGEMADEMLLASARVEPTRLSASGYTFCHPVLDQAVDSLLRRCRKREQKKGE